MKNQQRFYTGSAIDSFHFVFFLYSKKYLNIEFSENFDVVDDRRVYKRRGISDKLADTRVARTVSLANLTRDDDNPTAYIFIRKSQRDT